MIRLDRCPVCGGQEISFSFRAPTNRAPADPQRWNVMRCAGCDHRFMDPQPTWEELAPYYNQAYDPYDPRHGVDDHTLAEARRCGEVRHIPLPERQRLLDVGCGAGAFLRLVRELGAIVKGIEPSDYAAQKTREQGLDVFCGTLEDYVETHGTAEPFDVITASHVLEHVPHPVNTLSAMSSLLAPGGYVWIAVPNASCYFSRRLGGRWDSADLPYHLMQFTPQSLRHAATSAGLTVRRIYTSTLPSSAAASLRLLLRHRYKIPRKLTMRLRFLDRHLAPRLSKKLDARADGEAIIAEFVKAPVHAALKA